MEQSWKNLPEFPFFRDLSLEDKPLLDLAFTRFPPPISEFTFTNLFIWRKSYQIKISRFQNFLCLFSEKGGNSFFFPPIGEGNIIECYRTLLHFLLERGISPKITRVPEEVLSRMDWKAEGIMAELDRNQSDYIYLVNDLIQLQGRRYHRKRNHIKKFKEKYNYQYVPLTPERISECLELETAWCDLRHCEVDPGLTNEFIAIKEGFTHFEAFGVMERLRPLPWENPSIKKRWSSISKRLIQISMAFIQRSTRPSFKVTGQDSPMSIGSRTWGRRV
jgi:hypothetical protein